MVYCKFSCIPHYLICYVGRKTRILVSIYRHHANRSVSYVFYQRDIESKRLLTSLGIGIITGIVLIVIQLIIAAIATDIKYAELIKELTRTGVYYKWQMLLH